MGSLEKGLIQQAPYGDKRAIFSELSLERSPLFITPETELEWLGYDRMLHTYALGVDTMVEIGRLTAQQKQELPFHEIRQKFQEAYGAPSTVDLVFSPDSPEPPFMDHAGPVILEETIERGERWASSYSDERRRVVSWFRDVAFFQERKRLEAEAASIK